MATGIKTQIDRLTAERDELRSIMMTVDLVDDTADLEECVDQLAFFFTSVFSST